MKFEEALAAMREGKKVRRFAWNDGAITRDDTSFWNINKDGKLVSVTFGGKADQPWVYIGILMADDWQIVEER